MHNEHVSHILKSVAALGVMAIGFAIGLYSWDEQHANIAIATSTLSTIAPAAGSVQGGEDIGAHYSLIDHDGNPVTQDTYANSYRLVFFGFTHCPDVCPATMKRLQSLMASNKIEAEKLRVLFITTDPDNDTPPVMKEYLKPLGDRFTGLTGTKEQTDATAHDFKAYVSRTEGNDGNHVINHSSYIYFFGPDNRLLEVFNAEDSPESMAQAIATLMPQG